ncbi:LysR family transcriptional regulator [Photobacterium sanguinicancri]|uniref:LysR family transcriptional regulator n=1 Tax=Photobacterium sanguinicancri TaxID=875932 RepID=UPI0021C45747|nr:LysR family transcriptional regulator [Photobacterium sanguinicancri]
MDKIRALRYFKRVAEVNSFSRVAEEFDVPPSSISRRIKDLEAELGVELIKRTTRHVSTTELGSIYYDAIAPALQKIDEADELISQKRDAVEGKLRISTTVNYGEKVLMPILQKFRQLHPSLVLDIDFSEERISLSQGSTDIAIRAGYMPEERVIAKPLSSALFCLVASPQTLAQLQSQAGKSLLTFDDIKASPALQYRSSHGVFSWWAIDEEERERIDTTPVLVCNSGETLLQAAINHEGIALFPSWWIKPYLVSGELVEVPTECQITSSPTVSLDIYIIYQQAKYQIPKVKACVDFLLANLTE